MALQLNLLMLFIYGMQRISIICQGICTGVVGDAIWGKFGTGRTRKDRGDTEMSL